MPTINGVGNAAADSIFVPQSSSDPVTVATALTTLRLKPSATVVIADTVQNIQKNLDALQKVAGKITSLSTTDSTQKLSVTATQYASHSALLAKWGATDGDTIEVTAVHAASAQAFVDAKPDYVSSITVSDTSANIQKNLDALQSLVSSGDLRQIVQTGASANLKITAAQLAADGDALGAIKNHAYTLAITNASVSATLGLDDQTALTANAKIKSIDVRDTTDAIETNLDALQRVGLRLKSISQTDADSAIDLTGAQYTQDSVALGKIITSYHLAVTRAAAAQTSALTANHKVLSISVADTAANISKKWSLLQHLTDSLSAIEVTDSSNAIAITGDQLAQSEDLLNKFTDDDDHTYKLAVSAVSAGSAAGVANVDHVDSIKVSDTADNVAANLDDLAAVNDLGLLKGIALSGKSFTLSMDAARLQGDSLTATQGVLNKITNGSYSLAVTGVSMTALNDLASNARIVSMQIGASSDQIESNLDTLYQLGKKVASIQQSDSGAALDVTQATFESRASVLAKIEGGYSVNLTAVTANKILTDAANAHVAGMSVADSGKNLLSHWNALRSVAGTLDGVTKTDDGSLSLSVDQYLSALNDQLIGKFDSDLKFDVSSASVAQATQIADDDAVEKIDVTDDSSAIAGSLSDLGDLASGGKLNSITVSTPATSLALHASQLDDAQSVLSLVKGGHYTLAVDQVDAADAKSLFTANSKIATMQVTGDASSIVDNLSDLSAIGHKLTSIEQTDASDTDLALTGAAFEQNQGTLAKILGGYQADLSAVAAAKAATFASSTYVNSLAVSDTGANLAHAWDTLGTLGSKVTDIAQTDSSALQLTMRQWSSAPGVSDKFSSDLAVSISGASVADLATLSDDDFVQHIQVTDTATAVSGALGDLADESKLTQIQISDPSTALAMSADTFAASSDVLGLVQGGNYNVALSDVAVADAATLGADSHVSAMDVTGSAADVGAAFDTLAALDSVNSISLTDEDGTLTLSSSQILDGGDTLAKIGSGFQIAATGVAMADLADVQAVSQVASVGISDTAENVSDNFADVLALGGSLSNLHLTDTTPVLSLSEEDWTSGADALGKIDGSYQVDLTAVAAGDAQTASDDSTVRQISVADTADDIATSWSTLVDLYNGGAGKLAALALTDSNPLTLTDDQQTAGADMIAALLPDETIQTAA
ncbi:MAG TPA: hypothetical protein VHD62_06835 [Opitutaceae bacterium]|nr:hypothetical protein [Opitutaceae bacterium]